MTADFKAPKGSRYAVISCDAHGEPGIRKDVLLDYFDAAHRGEFKDWLDANPPKPGAVLDSETSQQYNDGIAMGYKKGPNQADHGWVDKAMAYSRLPELPDMGDPKARAAHVESLGCVAEVINPSFGMFINAAFGADCDMLDAARWAYLRWSADYGDAVPGRLALTMAIEGACRWLPEKGHDLESALEQVRWGRENGLTGGVQAPVPYGDVPETYDPYWEPLWALCSELDIPLVYHGNCHGPINSLITGSLTGSLGSGSPAFAVTMLESGYHSKRNFWHLMAAGVLDRYPNLKLAFIEQHTSSIVGLLMEFDHIVSTIAPNAGAFGALKSLKMLPSEYWEKHCLFGAPFLRPEEVEFLRSSRIGLKTLAWGSDYPHIEGSYPDFKAGLRYAFGGLPEDELRRILSERAAKMFGFDLEALQVVADKCGPSVADLAKPLSKGDLPSYALSGAYDQSSVAA